MGRQQSFYPRSSTQDKASRSSQIRRGSIGRREESRDIDDNDGVIERFCFRDGGEIIEEDELDRCPEGEDPAEWNANVAAGKAFSILDDRENVLLSIERSSVYGAALVMPQLARTAKGSLSFTSLGIRSYFLLAANLLLQGFLLYMISKEERVMDKFAGEPHVCNFASHIGSCPDGPNCHGPGGSVESPDRLYDWTVFSTRLFVKQTFVAMFPDREHEIHQKVDPGEFGVESHYLRIVSVFIFILGLYGDLAATCELAFLLWNVPGEAEPWMIYEPPDLQAKQERAAGWSELDYVKFKIAGMSCRWKMINVACVLFPKAYLWILTVDIGSVFLMETTKIEDMIINSATLAFILNIDELICVSIMPSMSHYIMETIEEFSLKDDEEDSFWNSDAVAIHKKDLDWNLKTTDFYFRVFPRRLIIIVFVTWFFTMKYYSENCRTLSDGSSVSTDVVMPVDDQLPFISFLFGPFPGLFHVELSSKRMWTMPTTKFFPVHMWRET